MGDTVTVCCKSPHGLVLELDELRHEIPSIGGSGGGPVPVWRPSGKKVTIRGSQADQPTSPNPGRTIGGYGITEVDKEFWDTWVAQKKGFPLLTNGTLFAQPSLDRAAHQARDQSSIKTGFEGLDPDRPAAGITRETGRAF